MIAQPGSPCGTAAVKERFRRPLRRGHSVIEFALMSPWILLLFIGIFDFGYYAYALINVENAARAGARFAADSWVVANDPTFVVNGSSSVETTCKAVLREMRSMPNLGSSNGYICGASSGINVQVAQQAYGPLDSPPSGTSCPPGNLASEACVAVQVTYQTVPLIPIPGLAGQMTINRTAWQRILQ